MSNYGKKHVGLSIGMSLLVAVSLIGCGGTASAKELNNPKTSSSKYTTSTAKVQKKSISPKCTPKTYPAFKVAILPNEPIFDDVVKMETLKSINAHHVDFNIFTGDTKNGHSVCTDKTIGEDLVTYFNKLNAPTLYSLGDNEWTDCHRTSNGSYDPIERLSYIRKVFFDKNALQGKNPFCLTRQGAPGEAYSENSRFVKNNVMFVALDVVGSNNNLVATEKQCTKKSKRTQADCDAATAEYQARNKANIQWLNDSFEEAKKNNLAGVVIAIQADIYFPYELSDGGYQDDFLAQLDDKNGFTDFFKTLDKQTHSFDGEVLLVHGDSHYFKIDQAMYDKDGAITHNFTRLETYGDTENSWVEMNVDPNAKPAFSFKPIVLKAIKK